MHVCIAETKVFMEVNGNLKLIGKLIFPYVGNYARCAVID